MKEQNTFEEIDYRGATTSKISKRKVVKLSNEKEMLVTEPLFYPVYLRGEPLVETVSLNHCHTDGGWI